jgi:hypothetical protein
MGVICWLHAPAALLPHKKPPVTHGMGTATRYGLVGPGIEFQWGARFFRLVQNGLGAHPASYTIGTWSLSRG